MIQHMYSPNNSLLQAHFQLILQSQQSQQSQQQQQTPHQHPHIQNVHHLNENPFLFDPLDTSNAVQMPLNTISFNSYLAGNTSGIPNVSQNTSPLSVSHVPLCKGTSKHFFKLENKIALLKEVLAVNPFEDSSRWKLVSDNYNIWTSANQPDRFYAAVDYLPRKVREMLTNFKNSLRNSESNEKANSEKDQTNANTSNDAILSKNTNEENDTSGDNPPGSSTSDLFDEADNQELRTLLYEVYQMMTNVGKGDKLKRNSIKRLKIETPKLQSLSISLRSPDKMETDRPLHSASSSAQKRSSPATNKKPAQSNISVQSPPSLGQFPTLETQFNFDPSSTPFTGPTSAGQQSSVPETVSSETNNVAINTQLQLFNKLLQPMMNRLNLLEKKLLVIENINRNNLGLPANVIPFNDMLRPGLPPFQDLPPLYTALDVENLTSEQLNIYLRYYRAPVEPSSSVSQKKRKLACFLGILNPDNYSDFTRG